MNKITESRNKREGRYAGRIMGRFAWAKNSRHMRNLLPIDSGKMRFGYSKQYKLLIDLPKQLDDYITTLLEQTINE